MMVVLDCFRFQREVNQAISARTLARTSASLAFLIFANYTLAHAASSSGLFQETPGKLSVAEAGRKQDCSS